MTPEDQIPENESTNVEVNLTKESSYVDEFIPTNPLPVVEDTTEEMSSQETIPAEKAVEEKLRIFLQTTGLETLTTILEKRFDTLGKDEFKSRLEIPGTYENIVAQVINEYSVEAERILKSIESLEDKTLFDNKFIRDGKTILTSVMTPRRPSGNGKTVTGQEARIAFAIQTGQVKRIPLYNSGFHLDIEAPSLTALNDFFNEAHSETNQYGREFGASFFYFNDLMIKEALIKLIMPLIMGSSLKNWNRGTTLLKNIKLFDLKVILNGIASLMFPDGFEYTHVCTKPDGTCTHYEEKLIDITKLTRHNFMKLTNENIDHMCSHVEITHEKIVEYQKSLNFTKSLRYDNLEFELKVPNLEDYLIYGKKFNAELTKTNFADNAVDVYQSLVFAYYKIYTPFIQSVTLYTSDGKKNVTTSDPDVISHQLSRLQIADKDRKFVEDMDAYMAESEITKICYPAMPCPKCNYQDTTKGYFTVDPEHNFFILSLKKLTPT